MMDQALLNSLAEKSIGFVERRRARMDRVDRMSRELRACVHEFGLTVVDAFMQCGVTNPRHIRHLVKTVHEGSVEIGCPSAGSAALKMRMRA